MRPSTAILLMSMALLPLTARGETTVTFDHPERYVDAGDLLRDPRSNMAIIERKLVDLGRRGLKPDDTLQITITDIDLAGTVRTATGGTVPQVRVMTGGADWPRITLRYTWTSGGRTVGPVEEVVADRNYLGFGPGSDVANDPLRYEQAMLARWFKDRFVARKAPPRRRAS